MEERTLDNEELLSDEDAKLILTLPDGEDSDPSLVGLTAEQLKKELARREAQAKKDEEALRLALEEGKKLLSEGKFEGAQKAFEQALRLDPVNLTARKGRWKARTQGYTQIQPLFMREIASEFAQEEEDVKQVMLQRVGDSLREKQRVLQSEATPIRERVLKKQAERKELFRANRNYYLWRTLLCVAVFFGFLIGVAVCANNITRTMENTPIILTAVFGGLALLALCVTLFFGRKLLVALRLCRANQRLSSTKEGAILLGLEENLACIHLVLGEKE